MNDLNIGIIGFGLVGKRHAIAIKKTNGLILSDIIEHDPTSLQDLDKNESYNIHNELDEYLDKNTMRVPKTGPGRPIESEIATLFDVTEDEAIKYASGGNLSRCIALSSV